MADYYIGFTDYSEVSAIGSNFTCIAAWQSITTLINAKPNKVILQITRKHDEHIITTFIIVKFRL